MAFTALRATPPLLAGVLLLSLGSAAWSAPRDEEELTLDERVARLEQQARNQNLAELFSRLDSLQRELQHLQGKLEEQGHQLETLQRSQKESPQALERRIEQLEQRTAEASPPPVAPEAAEQAPNGSPPPAESPELQPAASDAGNEAAAYQQAFDLLKKGSYDKAITGFKDFLKRYPNGANAANAQYWLGETYYVTRKFKEAHQAFQTLLERYPSSPKQPDARLKIGFIYYEQSEWVKARKALSEVASRYPGTAASKLAQARLDKMQKEGR